jgi:hypothetical protein
VAAADGDAAAIPGRLADALAPLASDPALRARLRLGALQAAAAHRWDRRVSEAYAPIVAALAPLARPGSQPNPQPCADGVQA